MSHFKTFAHRTVMVFKRRILCVFSNNDKFILLGTLEILPDHKSMGTIFLKFGKLSLLVRIKKKSSRMVWRLKRINLTGPLPQNPEV